MRNAIPTLGTISWGCRLMRPAVALALLLVLGFAQTGVAQSNQLNFFKNYFVTGDYGVAGWVEGAPDKSGFAPGTISIPDTMQPPQTGVPATVPVGADIVAAYLYWGTVESTNPGAITGQQGFFNGYPIFGKGLGNPKAPTNWSSGGCGGSSQGSKTMQVYRADVRPYLPVDANGRFQANNVTYQVRLRDSGTNGNTVPFALGATLVIIFRVQQQSFPLNSIILYDGAFAPSNASSDVIEMSQNITGFYQAAASPVAKITHVVANGQKNKNEKVFFNGTDPLLSIYTNLPPFPGIYGRWDNPTWITSHDLNVLDTEAT